MKIFATRRMSAEDQNIFKSKDITVNQWTEKREPTEAELIDNCKDADGILVSGGTKITTGFLNACSHLKVISLVSVGYDNVAIKAATQHKIPVGHTPGVLSKATADAAFLLMLATSRKAFYHHKKIIDGDWDFFEPNTGLGIDMHNKTLGIMGLGNIGYEMARLCKQAYGMDIIYHNRSTKDNAEKDLNARKVTFDELLKESDVLSVHANLTPETKGTFNAAAFAKMKRNAIFINTARGGLHNETDLTKALQDGLLWGAGLDVTDPEPMDKDNPLLGMENVSVLPHIGSAVKETREAMMELAARNIIAGLMGEQLPKCVNPEVYG